MSQFKTFLLPDTPDPEAELDLNSFLRAHRVVDVQKAHGAKGWLFCVEWLDGQLEGPRGLKYQERVDYMKELEPKVFAVFSRLRVVRKELAREAGVPPFGVATDAQLAEMAKLEKPTLAGIGKVDGFGESRLKAYGAKLLEALAPPSGDATPERP